MDKYISRDDVIKKIAEKQDKAMYGREDVAFYQAIKIIRDEPALDVQPADRWISCKEKMPEDNTSVLFVYVSENGVKSVHYGYHQTLKGLGSSWAKPSGGWQYCDDDVTHWQPLPEPPKDGDKE